jgi:diguanylate cyclase (GGDEF)-like protein
MTIKTKILFLGLLAIASLSHILGIRIVSERREHAEKLSLLTRMETAEKLAELVHELQKERGVSAGYLVIHSESNTDFLAAQRANTNKAKTKLESSDTRSLDYLTRLGTTREKISGQQMASVDSFGYYTQTIVELLDRIDALARESNTTMLKNGLRTHVHLLYAKEYLGQIRASVNESLSHGVMDRERVAVVGRQLNLHQFYSRMILREASPDIAEAMGAALEQPRAKRTFEIIDAMLFGRKGTPSAAQWFAIASETIDQLLDVEKQSINQLRQQARVEIAESERRLLIDAGVTFVAALALMFLATSAVLSLLRALNVLITNIEHTVSTQDFSNRILPQGADEMGSLSHNFNELMSIAEHLIKEKDYFASTDLLTGAYNRYRFTQLFEIELQRVLRYGGALALIMFDIDYFKRINDDFGHAEGDAVLKEIAHLVRDLIRASDALVRWGGEEFMILVPHTGDEAADLAEKLRTAVENHRFPQIPRVTVSFGVSAFVPGDTLETLFARTDEALYLAKNQGRNCVRSSTPAAVDLA